MNYRILGPLEVGNEDAPARIAGVKQRVLVAVLLLNANRVVAADRLIEELWDGDPPQTAAKSLQVYVSRLRKSLGANGGFGAANGTIVTRAPGYMIALNPDELDSSRFERLVAAASEAAEGGDLAGAEDLLSEALALWRGPAFADVELGPLVEQERRRLEDLRLGARERRAQARLALGSHAEVIAELEALVAEDPFNERSPALLMLALYRCGRQAEALGVYRTARRRLVDELGIEPGPELRELQGSILRQDPRLDPPQPAAEPVLDSEARTDGRRPTATGRPSSRLPAALVLIGAAAIAALVISLISDPGESPTVEPNSVAIIDVTTDRVVDQVPVGADPSDVSATGGSVWVANTSDDTVSEIDPQTRRVESTIAPGTAVAAMVAGEGAVWTSDPRRGLTARIDPALRSVDRSIRREGRNDFFNRPVPLAAGAGAIWAVTSASEVARIDPDSRRIVDRTPVTSAPVDVAAGEGAIWVSDTEVSKIDPASDGVVATIPVGPDPSGIAAGGGGVWVADEVEDRVARIDPETNSVTDTIAVGRRPAGVTVGAGAVWVANSGDGTVSRIDPGSRAVSATIEVGESPQRLAVIDDQLWVSVRAGTESSLDPGAAGADDPPRLVMYRGGSETGQSTDPALAIPQSRVNFATTALLLNYPDEPFPEGARLQPDVAESLPRISDGGGTYTYRLRDGFRFSPPSGRPVRASAFERAIERALDPRTGSYAGELVDDIVGLRSYQAGRTEHIAGVDAERDTLTIRLTAPSPTFAARVATPYFSAVPPDTPIKPGGIEGIPSAGPYYFGSSDQSDALTLVRNPNYGGERPAAFEQIDVIRESSATTVADIDEGRADALLLATGEQDEAGIDERYGPGSDAASAGGQRYFSFPNLYVLSYAFNTQRPLFESPSMRRAVSYALDRQSLAQDPNQAQIGQPTDQYIPPGMRGFRDARIYDLSTPDVERARQLAQGRRGTAVLYTCTDLGCRQNAETVRANLEAIGIRVEIRQFSWADLYERISTPGERWDLADTGWWADYADPFQNINVLYGADEINFGGFADPRFQRRMSAVARLTGGRRYSAYARLDADLARLGAPAAAYAYESENWFFSERIGCQINQPVYGLDLGALCLRESG